MKKVIEIDVEMRKKHHWGLLGFLLQLFVVLIPGYVFYREYPQYIGAIICLYIWILPFTIFAFLSIQQASKNRNYKNINKIPD